MGYTTYGIGVKISKVEAAIGSQNASLMAIETSEICPPIESKIEGHSYTVKSALADLISGNLARSSAAPDLFVYALETICIHLGTRLDGEGHIKFLEDVEWSITYTPLNKYFDLPDPGTFPEARLITFAQICEQHEKYESDTDHEEGSIVDAREEYLWWLKQCIDLKSDLVTFCY